MVQNLILTIAPFLSSLLSFGGYLSSGLIQVSLYREFQLHTVLIKQHETAPSNMLQVDSKERDNAGPIIQILL